VGLLVAACSAEVRLPFVPLAESPRDQYLESLDFAGLSGTALVRDWAQAGDSALADPVEIAPPYREEGILDPAVPEAVAYRVILRRGQRVRVEAGVESPDDSAAVFIDLFLADSLDGPVRVRSPRPGSGPIEFEPRRGGEVLIRIQPELLRGGTFSTHVTVSGALSFPVEGRGMSAILSFFGDDREAGRRVHHGVDIFAPRGTPVLAATDGVVTRVATQPLGGHVVWVRDEERGINQYYAHLDAQFVEPGDTVRRGDPVGTVGNTGNARTTPPHLHFGLYQRGEGPVDPWYFLLQPPPSAPPSVVAAADLPDWVAPREDGIRLRTTPNPRAGIVAELAQGEALQVMAGAGEWLRVRLPDGRGGFILGRLTTPVEGAEGAVRTASLGGRGVAR
jgi:peptidoglycan LD-endopeptidase LytH